MIGIILSPNKLDRILKNTEEHENFDFYTSLANQNKVDLFFYSIRQLKKNVQKVNGYVYYYKESLLLPKRVPFPKTNILRTGLSSSLSYQEMIQFEKKHRIRFINLVPKRNKFEIYQRLYKNKDLRSFLPMTKKLNSKTLLQYLDTYSKFIIKPTDGAHGEGLYLFAKENDEILINYIENQQQHTLTFVKSTLLTFCRKTFRPPNLYLVQSWIDLIEYENSPSDIRISIQKNKNNQWDMSGIVVRIAKKGTIATNIYQGGRAIPYEGFQEQLPSSTMPEIRLIGINVAKTLEKTFPHIADLGIDMGIDKQGDRKSVV